MIIKVFYTIHDGGDGSVSVRFHTTEALGDAAMQKDVDSQHLNDGEGCNTVEFNTDHFPVVETMTHRKYKIESDKLSLHEWLDEGTAERWHGFKDWNVLWTKLEDAGIYPPSVLDSTISLVQSEYEE